MKRAWTLAAVAVAVAVTTAVVFAGQEQSSGVIFARSRAVKYSPLVPGVGSYVAWGDTTKGPFGGFTKFRPGFDAGMHTHTADVLVVVLRGAYLYRDDAGAKRGGPGDFIRIQGGHKHWSGGERKQRDRSRSGGGVRGSRCVAARRLPPQDRGRSAASLPRSRVAGIGQRIRS